jgi:SAM-dependent methyltransferase
VEELGLKNVEFLHADILQLKNLKRKFNIIECVGTLHHMKDPVAGLRVLLNLLETNGFLKLGLYSEIARQNITKARNFIKKKKIKSTIEDIRNFREIINNEDVDPALKKIFESKDFYSTSMARDLMFHVQEHRFKLPEISKILKNFNLEFLGFSNQYIKSKFSKMFPEDKKNISLENWDKFENSNPNTFYNMYQFWVRKT